MAPQDDTYHTLEYMLCNKIGEPLSLKQHFLETITNNFSKDNLIGCGGYGEVYKGVLKDGLVAVKKLHSAHAIEDEPFHREKNEKGCFASSICIMEAFTSILLLDHVGFHGVFVTK